MWSTGHAPACGLSHYELGMLLVHSEKWTEAAEELRQAVTHDPTLGPAFYQLGRVYARLGETEKSQLMLAEFKKLRSNRKATTHVQPTWHETKTPEKKPSSEIAAGPGVQ